MIHTRRKSTPKPAAGLTFADLVEIEPRLGTLYDDIVRLRRLTRSRKAFCGNNLWYGWYDSQGNLLLNQGLWGRMSQLVGWGRTDKTVPLLNSCEAYALAYRVLYDALPHCRRCRWCPRAEFLQA